MNENQPTARWKNIFLSPGEPRLRSGWRIAVHTIFFNILVACLAIPYAISILVVDLSDSELWISQFISFFSITLSVFLARRFIDRRTVSSLGIQPSSRLLPDLFAGFSIAGLMQALVFGLEIGFGWLEVESFAWSHTADLQILDNLPLSMETKTGLYIAGAVAIWLLYFTIVGWSEELLFRGYRLQNISDGLNPWWALFLSSLWFGAAHWLNPGASWKSMVGILLAGIFMASGYLRTQQLWLPIGLHIGWNFFEGTVFGFPVSGLNLFSLIHPVITGPEAWTGGTFGPEAGLVLLPALLLGSLLIFSYTRLTKARIVDMKG